MYALDFEYAEHSLSDYGFIICDFNSKDDANTIDIGAKIKFNTVSHNKGASQSLVGIEYEDCIETTFHICRNPDIFDDKEITTEEYLEIVRWLNRKRFYKFHFIDDENERTPCYYNVSFNVSKVVIADRLVGIELEMHTDKPFGYSDKIVKTLNFDKFSFKKNIIDISDDIGEVVPNIEITIGQIEGKKELTIENTLTNKKMIIDNCVANENIIINSKTLAISTNIPEHKILNDFNFEFLTIGNKYNDRKNVISVNNIPCNITISYEPIIKNIPN